MPTSLTDKGSNNNDRRRYTNEQSDEESMNIIDDINYTLNDIYNPSSFPLPTTFLAPSIVDYDKLLSEIMNGMRSSSNREFERFYESFFSKENDTNQRRFPLRPPSPLLLPSHVLDARTVINNETTTENESDDFLELANQIINNVNDRTHQHVSNLDNSQESVAIERPRREAVPISNLEDEEPLLLYNERKGESPTAHHQMYINLDDVKEEQEEQIDELLMIKRSPLTINYVEYISSNDHEYEPQQFGFEQQQQQQELFDIDEFSNVQPTQNASLFRENINGNEKEEEEEEGLSSWLCFDSETELQEFKKSFKEQEKKMTTTTTTKELPTSLLNKINAIIENECIIEQDTFANVEHNTALKRRQDELSYTDGSFTYTKRKDDNKLSYTDGCFTYTKRIKPSL